MTHQSSEVAGAHVEPRAGSATLPAFGACILTLIWGAYTALYLFEVLSMPLPAR